MWDRRASPPALTPLPGACPAGDGRGLTWVTLGWCQARRGCLQPDQSQAGHQSSHRRMHRPHLPSPATARDTPSSTHPPTDTDTGLKTPGRQTQLPRPTHTHTHKPLPDRPAWKTPTHHRTPQPLAARPADTCRPAMTLLGHTHPLYPTHVSKHQTRHTLGNRHRGTWSPPSRYTNPRQTQTHPGEGRTRQPESTPEKLKPHTQPCTPGTRGESKGRQRGQRVHCSHSVSMRVCTHIPVWMHAEQMCTRGKGRRGEAGPSTPPSEGLWF